LEAEARIELANTGFTIPVRFEFINGVVAGVIQVRYVGWTG
jgi:hypothetical protein